MNIEDSRGTAIVHESEDLNTKTRAEVDESLLFEVDEEDKQSFSESSDHDDENYDPDEGRSSLINYDENENHNLNRG